MADSVARLAEKEAAEAAAAAAAMAALAQEAAIDEQKAELRAAAAVGAGASPYRAPGGRWGKFRRYSVWQRTFEIWSFAIAFLFRLWLSGRKFTYGKQARAWPGSPYHTRAMQGGFSRASDFPARFAEHSARGQARTLWPPRGHGACYAWIVRCQQRDWEAPLIWVRAGSAGYDAGACVCAQGGPGCLAARGPCAPGCGPQPALCTGMC